MRQIIDCCEPPGVARRRRAPVVDFHIHASDAREWFPEMRNLNLRYRATNSIDAVLNENGEMTPDRFLNFLDCSGADYAVILAGRIPTHEYVDKFCSYSQRLIPFMNYNPAADPDPCAKLDYWLGQRGFRGVKLLPNLHHFYPNDRGLYTFYEAAQKYDVPLLFHIGSSIFPGAKLKYCDPICLDEIASDFPWLKFIIAHGGRGFWYGQAAFLARKHYNIYIEVSGLPPQKLLGLFPDLEENSHKYIFGSDWPGAPGIKQNIEAIKALTISDEAKDRLLGLNALEMLKLAPAAVNK